MPQLSFFLGLSFLKKPFNKVIAVEFILILAKFLLFLLKVLNGEVNTITRKLTLIKTEALFYIENVF